jgi:ubiquinone/menaquinone biosynthesis C-methylase UbiE
MKKVYNPYLKRSISRNYIEKIQRNRLGAEITFPLRDITDVLSGWEGDFSGYSLLDIGCGTGNISNHESIKRFKSYVGIEPSKEFFEYANKYNKNNNTEFYNCSAEDLPFDDESFDFVISIEMWYYIKDIDKAAKELSRVLKNNSHFLIHTRNPDEMLNWDQIQEVISESNDDLRVHSGITIQEGVLDLGEYFIPKLSLEDLTNSFVNANLKIREVEKYKYDRIMIQGVKND